MELNSMIDEMLELVSNGKQWHGFTCDCGSMWVDGNEVVVIFNGVDVYCGNDHKQICNAVMTHQPNMDEWNKFVHSIYIDGWDSYIEIHSR